MDQRSDADQVVSEAQTSTPASIHAGTMARPRQRVRRGTATPNQTLAVVCVGIMLANLDLFIVNVALPDIATDFGQAAL